jgi:alcohol dehydrogenase (cytochrome c)
LLTDQNAAVIAKIIEGTIRSKTAWGLRRRSDRRIPMETERTPVFSRSPVFSWIAAGLPAATLLVGVAGSADRARAADDWFTMNKDYSSQRYVDLDQITPENIGDLKEVCEVQLNQAVIFGSGLLMVGDTLYVGTNRQTVAFDAATCALRWRHVLDFNHTPIGSGVRGLGYLDGKVFRGTNDGRVMAFDARTGQVLWEVQASDPSKLEMFSSAPIAWKGKVFIGIAFSDAGIAGRLLALDINTGKELWRFNTTLGFKAGGGFWSSYSLDPATGEVFAGVANPFEDFNRDLVPDDAARTVYTNSLISVDSASGRLNWHFQAVPRDEHDWDLATAPTLYRSSGGRDMLAIAGKDGRVHGIDRTTRTPIFNTPGTTTENDDVPLDTTWKYVCPGLQGGAMFNGAAYSPDEGILYVGMSDHCAWFTKGSPYKDWSAAARFGGPKGWITALDGETGAVRWQYHADAQVLAGLVPTKSGLLFAGDTHGNLIAFRAKDGSLLRSIDAGGALNNGLISYSTGGAQYVAAAVGGATENPSTVAGPLRVVVYGLHASEKPTIVTLDRLRPSAFPRVSANEASFNQNCQQCHGRGGSGGSAPPLTRQSQLGDPELLKQFLATVRPPMPLLYPGVLDDSEVQMIADYLRTDVFKCGPGEVQSCEAPARPTSGGTKEWQDVYSVLTSPRCINCHSIVSNLPTYLGYPQDYPRQGDDRHPHYYSVLRGDIFDFETAERTGIVHPGMGMPVERCSSCHGANNDPKTGIPGAHDPANPGETFWFMAPASMAWESKPGVTLSGPELCAMIKDKSRNGNRELADTLHHLTTEILVLWGYDPGTRPNGEPRTKPPIDHDTLVLEFAQWMNQGAPCPTE